MIYLKDLNMSNTLIIIPTYNESNNIERILINIVNLYADCDILVVDDNSPDGTHLIVEKNMTKYQNINLIIRKSKSGLGSAYIDAFNFAINNSYKRVIQIDADLSHNPKDIKRLLSESEQYDLIIGSRYISGISIINWPLSRLILSYLANIYARFFTGMTIKDCTGGFKCFDINVIKSINLENINSQGYSFQIEMNYMAYKNNFKIKEIPIVFTDRTIGKSKMSKKIILEAILVVPFLRFKNFFK